jgi:hypothetical protein
MTLIPVRRLFRKGWSVFWATTYDCEVVAFDEYFLGQLRHGGLNATILADHRALSETWRALTDAGMLGRVRRVNRDFLLRQVSWHARAFHPKTYLFGNEEGGTLVVGSGNAGVSGLGIGHEVFSTFVSSDTDDLREIAAWRDWMEEVVSLLDDGLVAARWSDAKSRMPWLSAASTMGASRFVSNLHTALIDRFLDGLPEVIDELHVSAPFWDEDLEAFSRLLDSTDASQVHVYLGERARVDGAALRRLLQDRAVSAHLWTYDQPEFVHAKLVAALSEGWGRLLSGSANASRAALMASARRGNVEAGVLTEGDADEIRALFTPAGLTLVALVPDDLVRFTADRPEATADLSHRLIRAELLPDGHLSIAVTPAPVPDVRVAGVGSDEPAVAVTIIPGPGTDLYPDLARGRTEDGWTSPATLVELVDGDGVVVSNRVAIDEPQALLAALAERDDTDRGALSDLDWHDLDNPVGAILEELQASCHFEAGRARKRRLVAQTETVAESDACFWQRLDKLDLVAAAGQRHSRFVRGHLDDDPTFAWLRTMLVQAPYLPELRALGDDTGSRDDEDPNEADHRWSVEARRRVRVFNVLKRWCRAVRDPELLALDPMLAAENYRALLHALGELWQGDRQARYLDEEHLHALLFQLLESMVGRGTNKGVFLVVDAATRERMLASLRANGAVDHVATLLFDVLRPQRRRLIDTVHTWQPILVTALKTGLVDTANVVIRDHLQWAAEFVDENGWCRRCEAEYGVHVAFAHEKLAAGYEVMLEMSGVMSLLDDPRAMSILQALLRFRRAAGIVLASHESDDRISLRDGDNAFARVGGQLLTSPAVVAFDQLQSIPDGRTLGSLFAAAEKCSMMAAA